MVNPSEKINELVLTYRQKFISETLEQTRMRINAGLCADFAAELVDILNASTDLKTQ